MGFSTSFEITVFFWSLFLGMAIGITYDFFRIIRYIAPAKPAALFAQDMFFWLMVSALSFFFTFSSNNGQMRMYILIGAIVGAIVYFVLISDIVTKPAEFIIRQLRAFFSAAYKKVIKPPFLFLKKLLKLKKNAIREEN